MSVKTHEETLSDTEDNSNPLAHSKKNTTEELKILVTKITDMTNDIGELVTAPASQQVRHWLPGLIKDTSLIASPSNICVPALVTRWPEPKFAVFLKPVKGFRQL